MVTYSQTRFAIHTTYQNIRTTLYRFVKFEIVGIGTFILDILLAALLIHAFDIPRLLAIALAFIVTVSINYTINRIWAFKGTSRGVIGGYAYFFILAIISLAITLSGVYLLTEYTNMPWPIARTLVAALVGILSFIANGIITFRML